MPPGIALEARAMIRTVHLTGRAEALARRPADNDVDVVCSDQGGKLIRLEFPQVAIKRMCHDWQVRFLTFNEVRP